MAHELTPAGSTSLVNALDAQGFDQLIKPLTQEIHLFDTYLSGTALLKDPSVLSGLKVGQALALQREVSRFDENTIHVLTKDGRQAGLIPEQDNLIFARLMDAGKLLQAKIQSIELKGALPRIKIGIYLVDF